MIAYHFLRDDMTAGYGDEPAWTVGEERTCEGELKLCAHGYHYGATWLDALDNAPGNVACIVDVDEPVAAAHHDGQKGVSRRRKLLAAANVERELRLFAGDCAERALLRERERGREPDKRSWDAIRIARRFADGEATKEELAAAWDAASAAASAAAWAAAWAAEIDWQRQHLAEMLDAVARKKQAAL